MVNDDRPRGIAIIGMACRFPGANTPAEFWENLRRGVESITFFSDEELLSAGVDAVLLRDPNYVKASPILNDVDGFDAAFFGFSPKEAAILDPQHRLFLETCWEAFEDAGYQPDANPSVVGVFAAAGSAPTSYLFAYANHPDMCGQTASLQHIDNDKDFLSTRVSFKLNLTGPSITVQTACSSSLVAVHLACQSLLSGECDMALAGASTVRIPHVAGYVAERGSVHSRDGHCRAFDAAGTGTIFGSGVAAVLLKPLAAALDDGDHIYAVIRGSAVNNDGGGKISYTAASATGQARAIVEAIEAAEIAADSIDYVECHATGTVEGDPVEVQALRRAFAMHGRTRPCAIGSVKTNIGHPEQAAGLAGLIKTSLSLERGAIPASLHYAEANPRIPFTNGPFHVQAASCDWVRRETPRRAAVNSLGIGGTNAFVVLEEAPNEVPRQATAPERPYIFSMSAKTKTALQANVERMLRFLASGHEPTIEEICHTANISRSRHWFRFAEVCSTNDELRAALSRFLAEDDQRSAGPTASYEDVPSGTPRPIAFLFSGQGTQHAGMAAQLYRLAPQFREALDRCDALLRHRLNTSLCDVLFHHERGTTTLNDTAITQPALFAVEYALAQLWQGWGITPTAVMGHSIGEIVAACVAGMLDLPEALDFVSERGALMQELPDGVMEAFFADEQHVRDTIRHLGGRIDIAAVNGPHNTVVAGETRAVDELRARFHADGIASKRLTVSRAFHSSMLDPILSRVEQASARVSSRRSAIRFVSNLTGTSLETIPSSHWRDHARHPVRFWDGMRALDELGCEIFVEIGPGSALLALGRQCLSEDKKVWLPSLNEKKSDWKVILASLARLYLERHEIDWTNVWSGATPRRVPLPTYAFERRRFWVTGAAAAREEVRPPKSHTPDSSRVDKSMYRLSWEKRRDSTTRVSRPPGAWIVFADRQGVGEAIADVLDRQNRAYHVVFRSDHFSSEATRRWTVDPADKGQFATLMRAISRDERQRLSAALLLWPIDLPPAHDMTLDHLTRAEDAGARSALHVVQGLADCHTCSDTRLWIVTRGAQRVTPGEGADPIQALLWGFGRTVALELPANWGGLIDLAAERAAVGHEADRVVHQVAEADGERQIALRGSATYVARLDRINPDEIRRRPVTISRDGTYLITGGTGMLGLRTASWLVERKGARFLALVSRKNPDDSVRCELARLEACGARLEFIAADVSDQADVDRMLEYVRRELPPLKGVIHGAGALADRIVTRMDWPMFERATAAKVRGGWLLDRYTRDLDLDFFLLQSSLLSLTGSAGQANYTAANAFLDAVADCRRAEGLPALAINWGPWAESGMAVAADRRSEERWLARGIGSIRPALGHDALDYVFDNAIGSCAVALCDWDQYVAQLPRSSPFYERLANHPLQLAREDTGRDLRSRLAETTPERRRNLVLEALRTEVVDELRLDGGIDDRQSLQQMGVDSLMSVNLANRLEARLGVRVPVATIVRGPSLADLADLLMSDGAPAPTLPGEAIATSERDPTSEFGSRSVTRADSWLVFRRPNDAALVRLFCFNFAGGGAAPFRAWAESLAPWIELVAVEPPGRGGRLGEPALTRLDRLLEGLMRAMAPYLDKPVAFFGHCLGALTLFESARHLVRQRFPDLVHLFVSGARPPHRVTDTGRFEEDLLNRLLKDNAFDPLRPFHEQPDETFSSLLRQFNIWATDALLAQPELRALLLPAIRADFKIASSYRYVSEPPWEIPITCFNGLDDPYVSRDDAVGWSRYTRREFRVHFRNGNHFLVVEDRDFIIGAINSTLESTKLM